MDTTAFVAVADYLSNPVTRKCVIICGCLFLPIGFSIGFFISRPFFDYVRWIREFRRRRAAEEAAKEAARQKAAAKKAEAENCLVQMRKAQEGVFYNTQGLLVDSERNVYCPCCLSQGIRQFATRDYKADIFCPRCGWHAPGIYFHIE